MIEKKQKKITRVILLCILVCGLLGYYTYFFVNIKDCHHGDECWSYGYSNSYYGGLVFLNDDLDAILEGQWLDGQFYRDYLEVQKGQEFSYGSVLYNISQDKTTSPIYYLALHTICSLFPETFSWGYGFAINIFAFAVTLFVLFFLAKEIIDNDIFAYVVCVWYGVGYGALNCCVYIRPYALMLMWTVVSMFIHAKMFRCTDQKKFNKLALLNMMILILGSMTQYYYLVLLFFTAFFMDLFYLIKKQWKRLVIYSVTMLSGVGASMAIWPKMIRDIFTSGDFYEEYSVPYRWDFSNLMNFFFGETTGILFPIIDKVVVIQVVSVIVGALVIYGIMLFLFRNEKWFKDGRYYVFETIKKICKVLKEGHTFIWILTGACLLSVAVIARISNVFIMGLLADRYVFHLMPFAVIFIAFLFYTLLHTFIKSLKKAFISFGVLCTVCVLMVYLFFPPTYAFKREGDMTIEEFGKDKNVVLVMDVEWRIIYYSEYLRNADHVFTICDKHAKEDAFATPDEMNYDNLCFVIEKDIFGSADGEVQREDITMTDIVSILEQKFGCKLEHKYDATYGGAGPVALYEGVETGSK